jgi:hypothetical protein
MGTRKQRTRNHGTWTEAQFWGRIRANLRQLSLHWKPRQEALKRQSVLLKINNRKRRFYRCLGCETWFENGVLQAHHKIEAGSLTCPEDLPGFVRRMFVEVDGWVGLCPECHEGEHRSGRLSDFVRNNAGRTSRGSK